MPPLAAIKIGYDTEQAKRALTDLDKTQKDFVDRVRTTKKEVEATDKSFKNLADSGSTLRSRLGAAFAGFTAFAVLKQATDTIATFDQTLAKVAAISGASGDQLRELEKTARDLGAATKFSATEAGEALVLLAQAGFGVKESIAAVPAVLNLAIAGDLALAEAADIASASLAQFNLVAGETTRVADVLAKTANTTNVNVSEIGESLKFFGPIAAAFNISIEEAGAAIGVLGNNGIKGALAGTNLRGVMSTLSEATDELVKGLEQVNVSYEDINPATNTLTEIFSEFSQANITASQALQIFGRQNAAAGLILTDNIGLLREAKEANDAAAGSAQQVANVMANNLRGAFDNLSSTIEEAMLITGDAGLRGTLRGTVDTFAASIRILFGFEDAADRANTTAIILAATIRTVGVALAVMTVAKTITFMINLATSVGGLTAAFQALKVALATNPLTALATLIITIGVGLSGVIGKLFETQEAVEDTAGSIQDLTISVERFERSMTAASRAREFRDAADEFRQLDDQVRNVESTIISLRQQSEKFGDQARVDLDSLRALTQTTLRPTSIGIRDSDTSAANAVTELERTLAILRRQRDQIEQIAKAREKSIETLVREEEERSKSRKSLEEYIRSIDVESTSLKLVGVEREKYLAFIKAYPDLIKLSAAEQNKFAAALEAAVVALAKQKEQQKAQEDALQREKDLAEARKASATALDELLKGYQEEAELLNLSADDREIIIAYRQAEELALKAGIKLTADQNRLITETLRLRQDLNRIVKEDAIGAYIVSMEQELDLLRQTERDRAINNALLRAEDIARAEGKTLTENQARAIREAATSLYDESRALEDNTRRQEELTEARKRATADIQSIFASMERELSLVGKSADERETELGIIELRNIAIEGQIEGTDQLIDRYKALRAQILEARKAEEARIKQAEFLKTLSDDSAREVGDFFEQIAFGTKKVVDALEEAVRDFQRVVFEQIVRKPFEQLVSSGLQGLFGGLGIGTVASADGNAFQGRRVIPFADGGLVDRPTFFPLANGATGLAGEAGAEAILPLRRGANGKLGVEASGGGGKTVIMNIRAMDAGSFRRSSRQILNDAREALR